MYSDSNDKENNLGAFIVVEPPEEKPDAHSDEDLDHEDPGNPDRLPRRVLKTPKLSLKVYLNDCYDEDVTVT